MSFTRDLHTFHIQVSSEKVKKNGLRTIMSRCS